MTPRKIKIFNKQILMNKEVINGVGYMIKMDPVIIMMVKIIVLFSK